MITVFLHVRGLYALGGPIVVGALYEGEFIHQTLSCREINATDSLPKTVRQIAARLLCQIQFETDSNLLVSAKGILSSGLAHPVDYLKYRSENCEVSLKCETIINRQLELIRFLYPNFKAVDSKFSKADDFFLDLLREGYNDDVHRRSAVWGLARWMYLNQEKLNDRHLYMPLWWRNLFSRETKALTARDLIGSAEVLAKSKRRKKS